MPSFRFLKIQSSQISDNSILSVFMINFLQNKNISTSQMYIHVLIFTQYLYYLVSKYLGFSTFLHTFSLSLSLCIHTHTRTHTLYTRKRALNQYTLETDSSSKTVEIHILLINISMTTLYVLCLYIAHQTFYIF